MSDWWNQPTRPILEPQASRSEPPAACPWCGCPAAPDGATCSNCGAVMAQDEDLSGLAIPGVTVVDPAVRRGAYTSAVIGAKSRLSTFGLIGTAGETTVEMAPAAVVLARSSLSGTGRSLLPEDIGNPSQAALEMAHLLHGVAEPAATRDPIELSTAETEPKVPQRPGDGAGV